LDVAASGEKMVNYKPEPIDTSKIILTEEYLKLTELIAKNTHETWAQQRIVEGWKYGSQRNDIRKEHPGLVPYEQLPESEKQYDRIISLEVIKTLLALGYRIAGNETTSPTSQLAEDAECDRILQILKKPSEINLTSLLKLRRQTIGIKPLTPDIYRLLGDYILQLGEPLMAYDVIAEGLQHWHDDVRLQQLQALALARSGATHRANAILSQLLNSGHCDAETLGILARTHKDLWRQATTPQEAIRQLRLAENRYEQAYRLTGSYWTGINAATMAMLMGEENQAKTLALQVRQQCLDLLQQRFYSEKYWLIATLGEAALILKEWSEAKDWYSQAVEIGKGRFGDLSSTRSNANSLIQHLQTDQISIDELFKIPRVVVFSGHRIDQSDRPTPRFPPEIEPIIYRTIRERLEKKDARLGYASAACGSDILFLEAILELGGEAHIILPYNKEEFIKNSVDIIPDSDWGQRFNWVMERATETIVASHPKLQETDVLYEYANRLVHGLAKMRAEQLETDFLTLAVWDGKPSNALGGTASAIAYWRNCGYDVEIINTEAILQQRDASLPSQQVAFPAVDFSSQDILFANTDESPEFSRQIMAMLFADVVHYSHLTEDQICPFVQYFLGNVADLIATSNYAPVVKNTWGDALYFVFENVRDAGLLALEVCDRIHSTNWSEKGLPENLSLRIALHAGPVYRHLDPVTEQISYIGTHVSHAARIEPIAPPNRVYASQAFAALAAAEAIADFTCDYVGQTPLAKGYGTFPTYHVRRR
jgi:class 3 adenylate cyclase/tetratricopeptide (TPR) repeat protein